MRYELPGADPLEFMTIILDLNGTILVNKTVVSGVSEGLAKLKELRFSSILFTGNTRGNTDSLDIEWRLAKDGDDKKSPP